jgi:hypothetical protein
MIAIPVVADMSVAYRPVAAQTDEEVFAMIVRVTVPKCEPRASTIVYPETIAGPDCSAAYPVMVVSVYMVIASSVSYQMGPVVVFYTRRSYCCVTMDTSPISSPDTVYCCLIVYNSRPLLWNSLS